MKVVYLRTIRLFSNPNPQAPDLCVDLERTSTAEQLADALRGRIMSGEVPPGTPIPDRDLSSSAGVARTTGREALLILAREGLVSQTLHRTATVTQIGTEEAREIYRVRAVLEAAGARAFAAAEPLAFAQLEDHFSDLADAARQKDGTAFVASDIAFHRHLVDVLSSPQLSRLEAAVLNQLRLAMSTVDRAGIDLERQISEHRSLTDQLVAGEIDAALATLRAHLGSAEERIVQIVSVDPSIEERASG